VFFVALCEINMDVMGGVLNKKNLCVFCVSFLCVLCGKELLFLGIEVQNFSYEIFKFAAQYREGIISFG